MKRITSTFFLFCMINSILIFNTNFLSAKTSFTSVINLELNSDNPNLGDDGDDDIPIDFDF